MADSKKETPKRKSSTTEAQRSAARSPETQDTAPGPRSTNEGFLTLYHCMRHNGGGAIDFDAASKELGISRNATYKRWIRMKAYCEKADIQYKKEMAEKQARTEKKDSAGESKGVGKKEDI